MQNGYELDELHNVQLITEQNNDFLVYNGTANVWQNQTPTQVKANLSLSTVATTGSYTDLANKPNLAVSLGGDITAYGNTGTDITATLTNSGVAAGTYGSDTVIPQITVDAKGRVTAVSNITAAGGGTYGNTQVAAYLPTYTGSLDSSSSITDLRANAATQATEIANLWSNAASQATTLAAKADTASLAAVALSGSYTDLSNRPTIPGQDSATANQVVYKNGSNAAVGSSGLTYNGSDLSVAGVVKSTYSSGDEGGEIQLALATTNTTLNTGVAIDINQNRLRIFETGGTNRGAYIDLTAAGAGVASNLLAGGSSTYGNTEVAAYLPTYSGNIGNISTSSGLFQRVKSTEGYFWANGTAYSTGSGGGTYGNVEVAAYLPTYTGNLRVGGITPDYPTDLILGTSASRSVYINSGYDINLNSNPGGGSINIVAREGEIVLDTTPGLSTYAITARSDTLINLEAPTITANGVIQNIRDGRIIANAYPLSTANTTVPGNGVSRFITHRPTYTAGVLQQPPLSNATVGGTGIVAISSQTVGMIQSANIAFQSGYGFGAQNRDTVNFLSQTTVTPVTANTMANQDRIRGGVFSLDLNLAGQTYGTMSTTSQNATTVAAVNGFVNLNGRGNVSSISGGTYGSFITPSANQTANIQYSTSLLSFLTLQGTAGTSGKANVVYHRALAPFIAGMTANLTVQNAVGLHTYLGWAGSGAIGTSGNPTTGRFAVLNEDTNTTIRTNGPVIVSNSSATFSGNVECSSQFNGGFLKFASYTAAGLTAYTGSTGQVASVSDQGGKLAYWDTTNTRWSYVHDNSAV